MTRIGSMAAAATAVCVLAGSQPAAAQGAAPDPQDLECLMVTFMMANSQDQNVRNSGALGAFYFLGKLQARSPGASLDKAMIDLVGKTSNEQINTIGQRCGTELQARGQAVNALGEQLQKAAAAEAAKNPPAAPATPPAPPAAAPPAKK